MHERDRITAGAAVRESTRLASLAVGATLLASPLLADGRVARTFDLGDGGRLVLDARIGSVTVTGTSSSIVQVVVTSNRDDLEANLELAFEEEPGVVRLSAFRKEPKNWFWEAFRWSSSDPIELEYQIRVPTSTSLEIDTSGGPVRIFDVQGAIELKTAGGSIGLRDLKGSVMAETAGGDMVLERIEGDVRVWTSDGDISATALNGSIFARTGVGTIEMTGISGDVDVGVLRGAVRIEDAGGHVTARSAQGTIDVGFAAGNESGGRINAMKGRVRVRVDRRSNLLVDAHATNGRVRTDLPVRPIGERSESTLKGTLGSGGRRLTLRSTDGTIVLNAH